MLPSPYLPPSYYNAVPQIVEEAMADVKAITGREYKPYQYYGAKDAESIIVIMGSGAEAVSETVYLGHFVRSSESVEEVHKRHFCFERGQVSDKRKVHYFLYKLWLTSKLSQAESISHINITAQRTRSPLS